MTRTKQVVNHLMWFLSLTSRRGLWALMETQGNVSVPLAYLGSGFLLIYALLLRVVHCQPLPSASLPDMHLPWYVFPQVRG